MYLIRPIKAEDLNDLETFALKASIGITSLPKNRTLLQKKIENSLRAFSIEVEKPGNEVYLFVLEEVNGSKKIDGVSAIYAKAGTKIPKYFYQIDVLKREETPWAIPTEFKILKQAFLRDGPSEIGTLFLSPEVRKGGLGKLLSLSRFLFMYSFPKRFERTVIAEMRGFIDQNFNCPFWNGVGSNFLKLSFPEVMRLLENGTEFVPLMLPEYPIYIDLLSRETRESIGKIHNNTQPALGMLVREGFKVTDYIDVFDGGPMIEAERQAIKTISEAKTASVNAFTSSFPNSTVYLLSNQDINFRACLSPIRIVDDLQVEISSETAAALNIELGCNICYTPIHQHKDTLNE